MQNNLYSKDSLRKQEELEQFLTSLHGLMLEESIQLKEGVIKESILKEKEDMLQICQNMNKEISDNVSAPIEIPTQLMSKIDSLYKKNLRHLNIIKLSAQEIVERINHGSITMYDKSANLSQLRSSSKINIYK